MWTESQDERRVAPTGVLANLVAVELLRWVLARCLNTEEALEVCGPWARCAQLPGPLSTVAAITAWQDANAWERCRRRVEGALLRGEHRRFMASIPCPTATALGSPSVEEAWTLLECERAHTFGH